MGFNNLIATNVEWMIWSKLTTHHNSISPLRCKGVRFVLVSFNACNSSSLCYFEINMRVVWLWFGLNNGWGFPSKELADFFRQLLSGALYRTTRLVHVMKPTRVLCPLRRAQVKQQMRRTHIFGSLQKSVASQRQLFLQLLTIHVHIFFQHILKSFLDHDCSTMHVKSFSGWMYYSSSTHQAVNHVSVSSAF